MRIAVASLLFFLYAATAFAQAATLRVEVRSEDGPVRGADVVVNRATRQTDAQGVATFTVEPGDATIVVVKAGFAPASASLTAASGQQQSVTIVLSRQAEVEEHVTVSATRTDRRVEDVPTRVEVLAPEEVQDRSRNAPGTSRR